MGGLRANQREMSRRCAKEGKQGKKVKSSCKSCFQSLRLEDEIGLLHVISDES